MNTTFPTKKILFATIDGDGHVNPLTGLAKAMQAAGYDVRWYTGNGYAEKIAQLDIPFYPMSIAPSIPASEIDDHLPGRREIKNKIKKLNYDIEHFFVRRAPLFFRDILKIRDTFDFDLMIADVAFTGTPMVKEVLGIPVIAIGVFPLCETSKDLPPCGLGMYPSYSFGGKIKQAILRMITQKVLFKPANKITTEVYGAQGISTKGKFVFDLMCEKCTYLLQSGTPSFEYKRNDLSSHIRYIGSLLPYAATQKTKGWYHEKLTRYEKVIVLTQGTVERNVEKLLVPALEGLQGTDVLVICTTGGSETAKLRKQYKADNIIIEDFIPFNEVMPYAQAYVTNGGYGGVMLGIEHKLPMVVAGVHEGKNEICARIGYFEYGIDLKTETPAPNKIREAVNKVINDARYKENIERLGQEFATYDPNALCLEYVESLIGPAIQALEKRA